MTVLSADDRWEIHDLLVRYAWLIDMEPSSEQEFVSLFTEDAVAESPTRGRFEGTEDLKELIRQAPSGVAGAGITRHNITNFLIEGEDDRATLKAYAEVFLTRRPAPADGESSPPAAPPPELVFSGHYECDVRKIDGEWKLASRLVYSDDLLGSRFDLGSIPWRELPPGHPRSWPAGWWEDPKYAGLITGRKQRPTAIAR